MKVNPLRIFAWTTIVSAFILVLYVGYVLTYPFKVSESKFTILSPEVQKGKNLILQTDYCKYRDLPAISSRQLVDGIVVELPPSNTNFPVGCHSVVRYIPIPTGVPSGTYRYQTTVTYEIAPFRKVSHTTVSNQFKVID